VRLADINPRRSNFELELEDCAILARACKDVPWGRDNETQDRLHALALGAAFEAAVIGMLGQDCIPSLVPDLNADLVELKLREPAAQPGAST
jgi:hypothetical protein